jgi:hypothetical protein
MVKLAAHNSATNALAIKNKKNSGSIRMEELTNIPPGETKLATDCQYIILKCRRK